MTWNMLGGDNININFSESAYNDFRRGGKGYWISVCLRSILQGYIV